MRVDRRFLNWGAFFILLGAIPLAVQANVIDRDVVARAWQIWPLLIVAAGIGILARRTPLEFAGGLLAAATFGLILGGFLATGGDFGGLGQACGNDQGRLFPTQQGTLTGGVVDVQFNCGDLTAGTTPGGGWSLAGTSDNGNPPRVDTSANRLSLRSGDNPGFFGFGVHQAWTLTLPQDPAYDLDVQLNAGTARLALGGAHLGTLQVQANAGSTVVDLAEVAAVAVLDVHVNAGSAKLNLPNASLTGTFEANAGFVAFCVPIGVGVHIATSDNITSGNNFAEQGLTKTGNSWETPGFATAATRVTLTANANAGSVNLNPKDGCR